MIKHFILFILAFGLAQVTLSQQGTIRGRVFDANTNEPLPFATIVVDGTTIGSISDFDGNFLFSGVEPGFVKLRVSSVGYETRITEELMVSNTRAAFVELGLRPTQLELEAVEIKASPFQRREESPLSLQRLGVREIERSPGSNRDISRVIQSLPGVSFTPAFRNDVIIRGGGPSENRFFLDGIEIPTINHFSTQGASGGPVGMINVDFIREVEMYSSAFPAGRGNALSSIFEFRQINGNRDRLNTRFTVGASDLAVAIDGPISSNTSIIFSARRSYLQLLFSIIGLPFLPTYNDFQFKTNTRLPNNAELNIIGIGALDNFRLNLNANETEEQRFLLDVLRVNNQWNYTIGATYRKFRSNGSDFFVISRNMLRNIIFKYPDNDESLQRTFDYVSDEIENKFRYERTINSGKFRMNFGAGGEYARFNNFLSQKVFLNNSAIPVENETKYSLFKWSVFGQATQTFLEDRLSLSFGIRADANSFSRSMSNLLDQLSPRLSFSYRIRNNLSLNASAGRYFQMPSYVTLGYRNPQGELVNKTNNLKYKAVDHLGAGFEFLPNRMSRFTIEGFYKSYSRYPFSVANQIAIGSQSTEFGIFGDEEVLSIGRGRSYGSEISFRTENLAKFNILMSYTFFRSEFENADGVNVPSRWDNRHLFTLTASRPLPQNWEVGFKWRFSGGAPYTPFDLELSSNVEAWNANRAPFLDFSRFNQNRLRSSHQLDLRIDRQFFFRTFSIMAYIDIQNVYGFKSQLPSNLIREVDENLNPITFMDENGIERYRMRLIENNTGTVLPTIGVIVEF